jgi:hypothetical protein
LGPSEAEIDAVFPPLSSLLNLDRSTMAKVLVHYTQPTVNMDRNTCARAQPPKHMWLLNAKIRDD